MKKRNRTSDEDFTAKRIRVISKVFVPYLGPFCYCYHSRNRREMGCVSERFRRIH